MGILMTKLSNLFEYWSTGTPAKILMLGLDAAGKTTILYKIKLNENVSTIPTIGFNVESVTPVKGISFTVWDVGGQDKIRRLWHHYYRNTDGLIFVVDSNDRHRVDEAREELSGILKCDEMRGVPVAVIANKQDMPNVMSPSHLADKLGLNKLHGRKWHIQGACAMKGDGIYESMHELSAMVKEFVKSRR